MSAGAYFMLSKACARLRKTAREREAERDGESKDSRLQQSDLVVIQERGGIECKNPEMTSEVGSVETCIVL